MPTMPPTINPLSTIAKFVYNQLTSNTEWASLSYIPTFYEEVIPIDVDTVNPVAMFCLKNPKVLKGAFGYTLMYCDNYEITSLVSGSDFSILEPLANIIAQTFDWQNQLVDYNGNVTTDPTVGRPRTQQLWVDPDNSLIHIVVMCMTLVKNIKYSMIVDGVNYVRMGGVYEIQYYQPDSIVTQITQTMYTISTSESIPYISANGVYILSTNTSALTLNMFPASGVGFQYQFTNVGSNSATISFNGSDTCNGNSSIVVLPGCTMIIASYLIGVWNMVYQPTANAGANPIVAITATTTVSRPTQNTTYKVAITNPTTITLFATTGSGIKLTFDLESLSTYTPTFVFNGSDTLESGASLSNLIVQGASFTLTDIASGVWAIE